MIAFISEILNQSSHNEQVINLFDWTSIDCTYLFIFYRQPLRPFPGPGPKKLRTWTGYKHGSRVLTLKKRKPTLKKRSWPLKNTERNFPIFYGNFLSKNRKNELNTEKKEPNTEKKELNHACVIEKNNGYFPNDYH